MRSRFGQHSGGDLLPRTSPQGLAAADKRGAIIGVGTAAAYRRSSVGGAAHSSSRGRAAALLACAGLLLLFLVARPRWTAGGGRRGGGSGSGDAAAALYAGANVTLFRISGRAAPLAPPPRGALDDAVLRAAVEACARARDEYVWIDAAAAAVVAAPDFETAVKGRPCPLVDISLGGEHRSIGLCTDAALYMHTLGARLVPAPGAALPLRVYEAACAPARTARMSLEVMHEAWWPARPPVAAGGAAAAGGESSAAGDLTPGAADATGAAVEVATASSNSSNSSSNSNGTSNSSSSTTAEAPAQQPPQQQQDKQQQEQQQPPSPDRSSPSSSSSSSSSQHYYIFAPNFENAYASDRPLHAAADLVVCKAAACAALFAPYLRDIGGRAKIVLTGACANKGAVRRVCVKRRPLPSAAPWPAAPRLPRRPPVRARPLTERPATNVFPLSLFGKQQPGHTAIDPTTAPLPSGGAAGGAAGAEALHHKDFDSFLHVRGKSGLKHTAQLLECWARHPEWPRLTVVGPLPNEQVNLTAAKRYLAAKNIVVPRPGVPDGACVLLLDRLREGAYV